MVSIAGINIETPLALAPMAGVTDVAFRTICREQGAGLTCTEMVSAKALCYQDKKTIPLLQLGEGEHPAAAQIFGSDPVCMQEGAAIAQTAYRNGVPFVILRAISDKADDSAQMDYPTFERIAAHRCAEVTRLLAKRLAEREA